MARAILDIAKDAAERDLSAPPPSQLFGTNDRIARVLRKAAKDTMREYLRSSHWQGLSEFYSELVFELVPGRYVYPLPPDYLRSIPKTEQRNGWPLGLVGPATPEAWANWVHGREAVSLPMGWRIKNNALWIEPTPTAHELVTIEYISRFPVVRTPTQADFDLTKTPPRVVAPLVPRDGFVSVDDASRYLSDNPLDGEYGQSPGYDVGQWPADFHQHLKRIAPTTGIDPVFQVRAADFEKDTDTPVFEDDYLLELGMTFRLRRALGKPYAEHAAEYEEELEMKSATDAGAGGSFRLGSEQGGYDTVPLGGGQWLVS